MEGGGHHERVRHAVLQPLSRLGELVRGVLRKTVIVITLVALGLGVFGFKYVEKQFFPDSSRPELMVELWMPEGTELQRRPKPRPSASRHALRKDREIVDSVTLFVGLAGAPRFYLPLDQILPADQRARRRS
ncbi:hypothetical protein ACU4GD_27635 [Cupriavidus basilensis]